MAFRLLALAVPDPVKMEIKISYPERDIMECTLVVIVFSVNAGKVINTRREVVEAVSLMRSCVFTWRPRGIKARFQRFFAFSREVYFLLTGNTRASDLQGDQSFLSLSLIHI